MQVQTINISLPKKLVKRIDEVAEEEYRNRSELIRTAVIGYLKDLEEWEEIFEFGKMAMKQMRIKSGKQVDEIVYGFRHDRKNS